jgi:cytolysin (calcineurin-like family phosphatase)
MTTSVGGFSSTYAIGVVWAQYFDVLSGEIEKNLFIIIFSDFIQIFLYYFAIKT